MSFVIALPNPFDPESERVLSGDVFETEEEANEWAAEIFDADEDGKIKIVLEYEDLDEV